jgi:hypothetical protein
VAINRGKLGCAFGIGDAPRLPLALGMGSRLLAPSRAL